MMMVQQFEKLTETAFRVVRTHSSISLRLLVIRPGQKRAQFLIENIQKK